MFFLKFKKFLHTSCASAFAVKRYRLRLTFFFAKTKIFSRQGNTHTSTRSVKINGGEHAYQYESVNCEIIHSTV